MLAEIYIPDKSGHKRPIRYVLLDEWLILNLDKTAADRLIADYKDGNGVMLKEHLHNSLNTMWRGAKTKGYATALQNLRVIQYPQNKRAEILAGKLRISKDRAFAEWLIPHLVNLGFVRTPKQKAVFTLDAPVYILIAVLVTAIYIILAQKSGIAHSIWAYIFGFLAFIITGAAFYFCARNANLHYIIYQTKYK